MKLGKLHRTDFMSLEMSPNVENDFTAPTLNSLGRMDVGTSCSQRSQSCQWFQHRGLWLRKDKLWYNELPLWGEKTWICFHLEQDSLLRGRWKQPIHLLDSSRAMLPLSCQEKQGNQERLWSAGLANVRLTHLLNLNLTFPVPKFTKFLISREFLVGFFFSSWPPS